MAKFNTAFSKTLLHEGKYVNDFQDKGGETYKGIARNFHKNWRGWDIIDAFKDIPMFPENLENSSDLKTLVKEIYKTKYWDCIKLSSFNSQIIADELFDTAVNMGPGTAARFLQKALNLLNRNQKNYADLVVDATIGAKTLEAVSLCNSTKLNTALNLLQGERYMKIVRKNPSQERFFNGWLNRVLITKN